AKRGAVKEYAYSRVGITRSLGKVDVLRRRLTTNLSFHEVRKVMAEKTEKCAHSGCHCPANADKGDCNDYCSRAAIEMDTHMTCECGHPECQKTPVIAPAKSS